jgi:hypothetical protein
MSLRQITKVFLKVGSLVKTVDHLLLSLLALSFSGKDLIHNVHFGKILSFGKILDLKITH